MGRQRLPADAGSLILLGGCLGDLYGERRIFAIGVASFGVASVLCALAPTIETLVAARALLAGPVFALVDQPSRGWLDPRDPGRPAQRGVRCSARSSSGSCARATRRSPAASSPAANFTFANVETLLVYAGLTSLFFFLTIYRQQVAGYSALESGLVGLPATLILFFLSRRVGALSARFGPRLLMGASPLIAATGVLLLVRIDESVGFFADLLAPMLLFGLGLTVTVAPLTATVMSDARRGDSGIASGVNNAVARVAGLLGIAIVGVAVAGRSGAKLDLAGFQIGMLLTALLVGAGGLVGLLGIRHSGVARGDDPVLSSRP